MEKFTAGVVTISDRASRGEYEDLSGPLAVKLLTEAGVEVVNQLVVSDDARDISEAVQNSAYDDVDFILTTGGTGISPNDYTARAMDPLLRFDIPGIAEAIRAEGVRNGAPAATLSRGRAGVLVSGRHRVLVVNAPGSTSGVRDTLNVLLPILEHTIGQMQGKDNHVHPNEQ